MYGTIARLKVKPGKLDELKQVGGQEGSDIYPDLVFQAVYQSNDNPADVWLVVGFSSREAYQRNAGSPEQHERYLYLRSLLDADPEWHDGDIIQAFSRI